MAKKVDNPTREELEIVKDHFEARGYPRLDDARAAKQTAIIRLIRQGRYGKE